MTDYWTGPEWTDLGEFGSLLVSSNGEIVDFVVPAEYREPAAYAPLSYEQVKQLNEVLAAWIQDYQTRNGDQK